MAQQRMTIELTVDITDENALVDSVRDSTPEDALQPDDIRPQDRASSALVAGLSKAVKALSIPGVTVNAAKVLSPK